VRFLERFLRNFVSFKDSYARSLKPNRCRNVVFVTIWIFCPPSLQINLQPWALTSWPPKLTISCACFVDNLCQLASNLFIRFHKYWQTRSIARPLCDSRASCQYITFASSVTEERTWQVEKNYASACQSGSWRRQKSPSAFSSISSPSQLYVSFMIFVTYFSSIVVISSLSCVDNDAGMHGKSLQQRPVCSVTMTSNVT